ncbi:YheC/YheD family protein [Desulfuribacillus alkaliarsenatis]|uniref:ATP-grasp domain-containing protein n=1 Tax=Desulfuribacillus alkaliarsenatis TaxID=766136 RepID=A0A1E5FZK6_9FIRM|nr:YheC/YheD family protein [Desulfuribacillus alkaliarsenatis]OEF96011.1 hypothetical protein BHF68_09700 [Desulfuribacillus alkaliarsenatis]
MLCTFYLKKAKLHIRFHKLDNLLKDRLEPLKIFWGNLELATISPKTNFVVDKMYSFKMKNETQISTPAIIMKYKIENHIVNIAPIVSILLDPMSVPGKTVKSKKGKMIVLNQLAEKLSKKGFAVTAIHPESVTCYNQTTISGYVYTCSSEGDKYTWEKAVFPFPKVIYNQISARKWEALETSKYAKEVIVKKIGEGFFNACFLNKYESYSILSENPYLKNFLLDVKIYNANNAVKMLKKYDMLYFKPISNSLGNGIWRLLKLKDRRFVFQTKRDNKVVNYVSKNVRKLLQLFESNIGNTRYLIQQGVKLLRHDDRIFDIRALTQKNCLGEWSLTGSGARVAAPNAFMTHVPNGGEIMDLDLILRNTIDDKEKLNDIYKQLNEMSTEIPRTIEKEFEVNFGEMSMDIGIDKNNNLFLIEINAKPMRFDEVEIQEEAVNKLSAYISYLSNWE